MKQSCIMRQCIAVSQKGQERTIVEYSLAGDTKSRLF